MDYLIEHYFWISYVGEKYNANVLFISSEKIRNSELHQFCDKYVNILLIGELSDQCDLVLTLSI